MTTSRRLCLLLLMLCGLSLGGCQPRTRYLVVIEATHFALYGGGNSLHLPLFFGTSKLDEVVRDVTQAERYYAKLAPVYGPKAYSFLADSTVEMLLEREGDLRLAQPVYSYTGPQARLEFSLVGFADNTAEFLFRETGTVTGQVRQHSVRIAAGQSASVGLYHDPVENRGHLVALAVKALAITPRLTPDSLAAFLRAKNRLPEGETAPAVYRPADQRWMDDLFGARALKLPVAAESEADSVVVDVPPAPVGGMGALAAKMVYPPSAVRDTVEGRVLVSALIGESGEVTQCRVLRGVRADLDSAAVRGVRAVRFTPAQADGKAVALQVAIPIAFQLRK